MKNLKALILLAGLLTITSEYGRSQSPTNNLNRLLAYYAVSVRVDSLAPAQIVPKFYSTIYHDVSGGNDLMTAFYSTGIPAGYDITYTWFKDGELWATGQSFMLNEVEWTCDNLFLLTLRIEYEGVFYERSAVCRIYWAGDILPDCDNEYTIAQSNTDSSCMSFCIPMFYEYILFPIDLDVNGDWVINTADLIALLATFE